MSYGQPASSWALMKTKAIDGMVVDLGTALQAERKGDDETGSLEPSRSSPRKRGPRS
jgi:hypothetical protein